MANPDNGSERGDLMQLLDQLQEEIIELEAIKQAASDYVKAHNFLISDKLKPSNTIAQFDDAIFCRDFYLKHLTELVSD